MVKRPAAWLPAVAISIAFVFRLFFGLSSQFFAQDVTQVYLLGLRYYATGVWPHFGPDVVWTNTQVPGALQALLVGLPFKVAAIPEAPWVLLNLLSTGALAALAWYICKRLPTMPPWLVWGWLLTIPWTLNFSTHIDNTSYVLPGAVVFFIAFFEAVPALRIGVVRPAVAHFMMGLAVGFVMQLHMSWPLLLPYTGIAWISGWRSGAASLLRNGAALAAGALLPALLLIPTLLAYGSGGSGGALHNLRFHMVSPTIAARTLARLFSFASLEIAPFIALDNASRLAFLGRHVLLVPFAAIAWVVGFLQPIWMLREWFRRSSPYREWVIIKWLVAASVLLVYVADWFVIERATQAHAYYVLAPTAFIFAAYCWTFIDSAAWRRRAAAILAINVCFEFGLAWAQMPERSLYKHRDVVAAAIETRQPEMLAHRRFFAIEAGPIVLQDPRRPHDAVRDLEMVETHAVSGRNVTWSVSIKNKSAAVAFRDVLCEMTYRTQAGALLGVRRTVIEDVWEPGESRRAELIDSGVGTAIGDVQIRIVAAEALLPLETSDASDLAAPLERLVHRHFVGVFKVAAHGNAHRDAGYPDAKRLEQPRQVDGGGFALDIRVRRQDHLGHAVPDARQQALDLQLVRPDALQRRQRAHQHVIHALEVARLLDSRDIRGLFDDADDVMIPVHVAAERAGVDVGDVVAHRTVRDALLHIAKGVSQPLGVVARALEDMEGQALRPLGADARQPLELFDESD
jgi:hypothetical protein